MSNEPISDKSRFARHLRRNLTYPERLLWSRLRDRRLDGHKFVRQAPIGPFVVDFLSRQWRLVIELDGASHDDQGVRDLRRQQQIKEPGFQIIRFSNDDVLRDLDVVLQGILKAVAASDHR